MERVKSELRALHPNPSKQKRKWVEWGAPSESVNQYAKKTIPTPSKSCPTSPTKPCGECSQTNYTTRKCRVGTNKCSWRGSTKHFIVAYPERLKSTNVGAVRSPLAPPKGHYLHFVKDHRLYSIKGLHLHLVKGFYL